MRIHPLRLAMVMALWCAAAAAAPRTLEGTVTYRERMALPPSAVLEVKLLDVSRADAAARTIAQTSVAPAGQVPIRYRLQFDDAEIVPGGRYALQARIMVEGQPWFATTTHHAVLAGGVDEAAIMVERVRTDPGASPAETPAGRWLAEDIRGGGVIDGLQTVLEIADDGTVTGSGGCNRMAGKATLSGNRITFGNAAATLMACVPAAMDQERKFFDALKDVRTWRVDPLRRKLTLLDGGGQPIIVLAKM